MEKIKLYRFCSRREAALLSAGKHIFNHTDHYRDGNGGSTSRGFCLTADSPEVAWKYLRGIVTPEVCCEYEIPVCFLKKSTGKYFGREIHCEQGTRIERTLKDEYCITFLRPEWLRREIPLEDFVSEHELEAARWFAAHKDSILSNSTLRTD